MTDIHVSNSNILKRSKSWLLMPPSAALTVTRVPYEESSVYCAENFFSPSPADVDGDRYAAIAADVRRIILQPGDVLIVPPKWWHYAECQTISLSVNSWIPLVSETMGDGRVGGGHACIYCCCSSASNSMAVMLHNKSRSTRV